MSKDSTADGCHACMEIMARGGTGNGLTHTCQRTGADPPICDACGVPAIHDSMCAVMGLRHVEPISNVVARAVKAETDRCARLAERKRDVARIKGWYSVAGACDMLARSIRNGEPMPTRDRSVDDEDERCRLREREE